MSKLSLTPERTHWIHDFDGVHYDTHLFDDVYGDIYAFYGQAKLKTARLLMPGLTWSDEEIIQRGKKSYFTHMDGLKVYIDFATASGITENALEFRRSFHKEYHQAAFANAMRTHSYVIAPDPALLSAMEELKPFVRHGMVTMSCLQTWAAPFLQKMDMLRFFEDHALIGAEEVGFLNKKDSTQPLQIGMEKLGARPEQTIFIEDTIENLAMAKELDPRILTVHVVHGNQNSGPVAECVDIRVPCLKSFVKQAQDIFRPSLMPTRATPAPVMV